MSIIRIRSERARARGIFAALSIPILAAAGVGSAQAATLAPVTGEIQSISINDPLDHWSGGTMIVGGQTVTIPRNLLMDLPANRLTLKQLYDQAPAACVAAVPAQTGLARGDTCNTSPVGAIATIHANRTGGGNIIAGDVFIQKGIEAVMGTVTYIDYTDGYFRVNGNVGDPATGVMVRLNDPEGRHTVQQGLGCTAGSTVNCSPDPRFTLDPDNYTNVFTTGYPLCIPSTVARTVATELPAILAAGVPGIAAGTIAQATADGTGDALCPSTNRAGSQVEDSRRLAPIQVGDSINAEGNFEKIDGVQFLSAHSTMVSRALQTKSVPGQPDYLFLDEVEIDLAGFQNQRVRTLIIGYATLAPTDVNVWSIHYDAATNSAHEFPLASVVGCDLAAGAGTCGAQGLVAAGANIFKIRHDVDFAAGAKARLNPCAHLRADPFFAPLNICPNGGAAEDTLPLHLAEQVAILTPIPHEIQARTGHSMRNPGMVTLDIRGNQAPNGQYLFPFGLGLGGIAMVEFNEINLDAIATPVFFSAMPWNLDRRLSPAGCIDTNADGIVDCEATPQPLDPFPFEELDPRFQASLPTSSHSDPNYTASILTDVRNRILSFVDPSVSRAAGNGFDVPAAGNFNGNSTILAWPPVNPASQLILPTPNLDLLCTINTTAPPPGTNVNPVANPDIVLVPVLVGTTVAVPVLLNDTDANGDVLTVTAVTNVVGGTATFTASAVNFTATTVGTGSFSYTISDGTATATATVTLTVTDGAPPPTNTAPVANPDNNLTVRAGSTVVISVLANDTDANGDALTVTAVANLIGGTATINANSTVSYLANAAFTGAGGFTYTISDGQGGSSSSLVTVNVLPAENLAIALSQFRTNKAEWRVSGTSSVEGATITVRFGDLTGPVIGAGQVVAGAWAVTVRGSTIVPTTGSTISIESSGGATAVGIPVAIRR